MLSGGLSRSHHNRMRLSTLLILTVILVGADSKAQTASTPIMVQPSLAPGDAVRIAVWREPDLSGDFIVNEVGVVTLPLLGRIDVVSVPLSELREKLIAAYAVQLRNPSVTVTPIRRVYVLGEVGKPGLYPVDPTTSLAGVLAMAGGATTTGDLHRIRIVRNGMVIHNRVDATSGVSIVNLRSDDQIFVERRSWLDRNGAVVASAVISTAGLVLSLVLR